MGVCKNKVVYNLKFLLWGGLFVCIMMIVCFVLKVSLVMVVLVCG